MIALIPARLSFSTNEAPPHRVTLPDAPFPIPQHDRADTAPRCLPVRHSAPWAKDSLLRWADRCAA